jgi:hypothetical protein
MSKLVNKRNSCQDEAMLESLVGTFFHDFQLYSTLLANRRAGNLTFILPRHVGLDVVLDYSKIAFVVGERNEWDSQVYLLYDDDLVLKGDPDSIYDDDVSYGLFGLFQASKKAVGDYMRREDRSN